MCTFSAIADTWGQRYPQVYPWASPNTVTTITIPSEVTKAEFDALKAEVEELKTLLLAAKKFDAATGQPDCEQDEKVALLKRVADLVGVDLEEVFG